MLRNFYRIFIFPYTVFLLYLMFFGFGRTVMDDHVLRLVPIVSTVGFIQKKLLLNDFRSLAVNILGNIVMFVPFGFLGWIFPKLRNFKPLVYRFLSVLLSVEALQYFTRLGVFDVDDLILNTLGVCIGFWIFKKLEPSSSLL